MRIGRQEKDIASALPLGQVAGTKLKSLLPVQGDWFCLEIVHEAQAPLRLFLHRVALWGLAEGADVVDHVIGIDETGVPHDDDWTDVYFVYGADLSPNGDTWLAVYGSVIPTIQQTREVTHLFEGFA